MWNFLERRAAGRGMWGVTLERLGGFPLLLPVRSQCHELHCWLQML